MQQPNCPYQYPDRIRPYNYSHYKPLEWQFSYIARSRERIYPSNGKDHGDANCNNIQHPLLSKTELPHLV